MAIVRAASLSSVKNVLRKIPNQLFCVEMLLPLYAIVAVLSRVQSASAEGKARQSATHRRGTWCGTRSSSLKAKTVGPTAIPWERLPELICRREQMRDEVCSIFAHLVEDVR